VSDIAKIKTTTVTFSEFSEYNFIDPATWFIVDALQNYVYFHTSRREVAQAKCDDMYGKKYIVKTSKMQKTKPRTESGEYTCR